MKLAFLEIEGYRSFRSKVGLHIDPRVTVLLGANDHGKSNLLAALVHLNKDDAFTSDDLNWDCTGREGELPCLMVEFALDANEIEILRTAENTLRRAAFIDALEQKIAAQLSSAQANVGDLTEQVGRAEAERARLERSIEQLRGSREPASQLQREQLRRSLSAVRATQSRVRAEHTRATKLATALASRLAVVTAKRLEEQATAEGRDPAQAPEQWRETRRAAADALESELATTRRALSGAQAAADRVGQEGTAEDVRKAKREVAPYEKAVAAAQEALDARRLDLEEADRLIFQYREVTGASLGEFGADGLRDFDADISLEEVQARDVPQRLRARRAGLVGEIEYSVPGLSDDAVLTALLNRLPRIELITPAAGIPDSVNLKELESEDAWFMRGIFHYAKLRRDTWPGIFTQNDQTLRQLDDASAQLNATLKQSWIQGSNLEFKLSHDSKQDRIELRIKDPSVQATYVRVSRRSSGFTHFFALKTIMAAREAESPASSYIWLFDEPGVYLHPDGQRDLMQVLETLAAANQIIYSTHSLFMLNKNYPVRHRLLYKSENGTQVDEKPYRARWRPAVDSLGLGLPGTVLFASAILLVEGDSDPVYIYALLQYLAGRGELNLDLNLLSVIPTADSRNADAIVRILSEGSPKPQLAFLLDNDGGGRDRAASVKALATTRDIPIGYLPVDHTSIEDYLPGGSAFYLRAVARYAAQVANSGEDEILGLMKAKLAEAEITPSQTHMISSRLKKLASEIAGKESDLSSVGIAREYQLLLEENREPVEPDSIARARAVAAVIAAVLPLPTQSLGQEGQGRIINEP